MEASADDPDARKVAKAEVIACIDSLKEQDKEGKPYVEVLKKVWSLAAPYLAVARPDSTGKTAVVVRSATSVHTMRASVV